MKTGYGLLRSAIQIPNTRTKSEHSKINITSSQLPKAAYGQIAGGAWVQTWALTYTTPPRAYFAKISLLWAFLMHLNWCGKVIAEPKQTRVFSK